MGTFVVATETCLKYRSADNSLARPGRKATFPAFYGTWMFIRTFTTVHHLSLLQPNQSIPLPITLLTGATCFFPGRARDLSAPQPNQSIPLPITLLTGAVCFFPGRAKDLSAPQPNESIPLPITLLTGAVCFLPGRSKDLSAPQQNQFIPLPITLDRRSLFPSWSG